MNDRVYSYLPTAKARGFNETLDKKLFLILFPVRLNMSTQKDDRKLDGKQLSTEILANIKNEIETLKSEGKPVPGLSVVLVGDRGDSATYVKMKERACNDVGIQFNLVRFDAKVEQETLIQECMFSLMFAL